MRSVELSVSILNKVNISYQKARNLLEEYFDSHPGEADAYNKIVDELDQTDDPSRREQLLTEITEMRELYQIMEPAGNLEQLCWSLRYSIAAEYNKTKKN